MALLYDAGPIEGVDFVRLLTEELVAPAAKQVADRLTVSVGCLRAWRIRGKGPPAIRVGSALRWDEQHRRWPSQGGHEPRSISISASLRALRRASAVMRSSA